MHSKIRILFSIIAFFILAGCKPAHFNITGLPALLDKAHVESVSVQDNTLILSLRTKESTIEVKINPWQSSDLDKKLLNSTLKAQTFHSPSGVIRNLEFYRGEDLIAKIGSGARNSSEIFPGYKLFQGKIIEKMDNANRNWTEALIKDQSGKETLCEPGKIVNLEQNGKKWAFVLIGASASLPKPEKKLSGTNILIGEIADEAPGFIADYVLFAEN